MVPQFLNLISTQISSAQNDMLLAPYTPKEVKAAVMSMHADKSPDLNGFNSGVLPAVLKYYWSSSFCVLYSVSS